MHHCYSNISNCGEYSDANYKEFEKNNKIDYSIKYPSELKLNDNYYYCNSKLLL